MAQKQALAADAAATKARMDAANALLGALAGEEARWTQQSQAFDDHILRLTGAVCACALCGRCGPANTCMPLFPAPSGLHAGQGHVA